MKNIASKSNLALNTPLFTLSRSPKRKPEDKAQKERRNQAAGQQIKEKASSVLKREKPLTSVRNAERGSASGSGHASGRGSLPSSTTPSSTRERKSASVTAASSRPAGLAKTKKEASNKTKKEEVVARSSKSATQR